MEKEVDIPKQQLQDLGFEEIRARLFQKFLSPSIVFFRDYRGKYPASYAYDTGKRVDATQFKIAALIEKIERAMSEIDIDGLEKVEVESI